MILYHKRIYSLLTNQFERQLPIHGIEEDKPSLYGDSPLKSMLEMGLTHYLIEQGLSNHDRNTGNL